MGTYLNLAKLSHDSLLAGFDLRHIVRDEDEFEEDEGQEEECG